MFFFDLILSKFTASFDFDLLSKSKSKKNLISKNNLLKIEINPEFRKLGSNKYFFKEEMIRLFLFFFTLRK